MKSVNERKCFTVKRNDEDEAAASEQTTRSHNAILFHISWFVSRCSRRLKVVSDSASFHQLNDGGQLQHPLAPRYPINHCSGAFRCSSSRVHDDDEEHLNAPLVRVVLRRRSLRGGSGTGSLWTSRSVSHQTKNRQS